jgi:hypothetical protein
MVDGIGIAGERRLNVPDEYQMIVDGLRAAAGSWDLGYALEIHDNRNVAILGAAGPQIAPETLQLADPLIGMEPSVNPLIPRAVRRSAPESWIPEVRRLVGTEFGAVGVALKQLVDVTPTLRFPSGAQTVKCSNGGRTAVGILVVAQDEDVLREAIKRRLQSSLPTAANLTARALASDFFLSPPLTPMHVGGSDVSWTGQTRLVA